jgi:hypothetical protein
MLSQQLNNPLKVIILIIKITYRIRLRIRIFIIQINGPTIGANKLHTLIIVFGGNYTYIYIKYL